MKLQYNPLSPFVRVAMVTAHELGVADRIEKVEAVPMPTSTLDGLNAANPLGKVPALTVDEMTLHDSRVIAEYLNEAHDGGLMPAKGPDLWRARTQLSMVLGALDAAVLVRYETFLRPEELRWQDWIDGQFGKVVRVLDQLEAGIGDFRGTRDGSARLDAIAAACLLGYIDFRFADHGWRDGRPKLAAWYLEFSARPSMRDTEPPA